MKRTVKTRPLLMLFTIKKSKSERFFQISFKGFIPKGKNAFDRFFKSWGEFFEVLRWYILKKLGILALFIFKGLVSLNSFPGKAKNYIVRKLIWSRGRLGRSVATFFIMMASLAVFIFGEILSGSTLIVDKEVTADYLATTTDIIPRMATATTLIPEQRKNNEPFAYAIQPGDTLSSIGNKFKISVDALKYVNNIYDTSVLTVGKEITIPPVSGLIHKVTTGDTLNSIASKYSVPSQAIADFNYILDTSKLALGSELVIPGGKVPAQVIITTDPSSPASVGPKSNAPADKGMCVWPSTVRIITQYFSWYHNGVDIATPLAGGMPPLLACTDGKVIRAGWDPFGLGLHVRIDHGNGFETVYGHMSRLDVSYGQSVDEGDIIGLMGNTGRSTGPHVHFMVKYNGVAQNPLNYTQ